ncbi:MAG: copper resistance protein CopC [Actinomycetota bacterium]
MTGLRRVAVLGALLAGALWMGAGPALAHANLLTSYPKSGATLATAPARVTLTFSEPVDVGLSLVSVLDATGADTHAAAAAAVSGQPRELSVSLPPQLPDGVYTVNWRAVSAADGHITQAAFAFGIGTPPGASSSVPQPAAPGVSVLAVIGKVLLYAGLSVLFAAAFVGLIAFGGVIPARRTVFIAASSAALVGAVAMLFAQEHAVGVSLGTLLRSEVGKPYLWLLALVAGTAAASTWAETARSRLALFLVGGGASGAMLARSIGGHASAAASRSWLQVGTQWLHFMSVGAWIGGLVLVALLVRSRREGVPPLSEVARFSTIAFWSVLVLILTGSIRVVNELGGISALTRVFHSSYGITLTIKVGVAAVLIGLGGINRYRSLPRLADGGHLFRRVIGAELVAALTLFGLTATLTSLPPAAGTAGPGSTVPTRISASGSDFATTTKVSLTATPGAPGLNTFTALVTDYDTGAPADATSVELQFQPKGSQVVGASTLALRHTEGTRWTASGTNISLAGSWSVTATVARSSATVEVPLTLTTRAPPQHFTVSRAAGQPDIYTFTLSGGEQLQIYIDPGTAGPSQFHVTAIGSDGDGLPLASATLSATPAGGDRRILVSTRLGPDHFVANTALPEGDWRFGVSATTKDGHTLQASFNQPIGAA